MNPPNTLTFKLKQHTPLIHFQPDQDGATLRASEVKPKLDKYLLGIVFENDFDRAKKYFIGYNSESEGSLKSKFEKGFTGFDYKLSLHIEANSIKIESIPEKFPCFFGNMGDENIANPKKFSFADRTIKLVCKTNHQLLHDELKKEVPNFFARNNFGNRQSKGFGSFFIDENDEKFQLPGLYSYFQYNTSSTQLSTISGKHKSVFGEIDMVHRAFRSGINDIGPGQVNLFYMKPLIWQYFKQRGIVWEKKRIKEVFFNTRLKEQITRRENELTDSESAEDWPLFYKSKKYGIIKDLLGVSSLEKWRVPYNSTITKKSATVERMKSPLFYKPIVVNGEGRVYIDFDDIPKGFLDSEFLISTNSDNFTLKTVDEFDIDYFFEWCLKKADIKALIDRRFRDTKKAKHILKLFGQLRTNINY